MGIDSGPSKKFWKNVSSSLSPLKRRQYSTEHPCYVPRPRAVLNDEFWLSQYRWYIYYFQPRRMKYIYFVLLIQQFYKFRGNQNICVALPETFTFYKDSLSQTLNHKRKRSHSRASKGDDEMKE